MAFTNQMLNDRKEKDCISITHERKYYRSGVSFIKRSLRPKEWQVSQFKGTIHVPRKGRERVLNEAATLQFLKENSAIPIPQLYCCFEDDDAVYLAMEYVEGVSMDRLTEDQRARVEGELEKHIQGLHALRSSRTGGPTGLVIPPYRAMQKSFNDNWEPQQSDKDEFVFCHNDRRICLYLNIELILRCLFVGDVRQPLALLVPIFYSYICGGFCQRRLGLPIQTGATGGSSSCSV
ncbi:hypothetical protein TMEN_9418 [Trichophyton mentagrophytes]|nr:hypothetical protein TMEN_9418 [Trichophyton mentagrophytes]